LLNDGDSATQVTLTLHDGAAAPVALRVSEPVTAELRAGPATFNLAPGDAVRVNLTGSIVEQPQAAAALLEIRSDRGARWQLPVTAASGSHAGLWVGDVTVNDVSESRLGGTNVADGALTIALRSQNASGIGGAAELREVVAGSSASVAMTLTLALPAAAAT